MAKQPPKEDEGTILIDESLIYADPAWNIRKSVEEILKDGTSIEGKEGENTLSDLANGLANEGQITPIIIRPRRRSKTTYDLVCGYRRLAALRSLKAREIPIKGMGVGTIRADVRNLDDKEARILNGAENIDRLDLSAPDKCHLVGELAKMGMTDKEISEQVGIQSQYCSKLHRIHSALSTFSVTVQGMPSQTALEFWRSYPTRAGVEVLQKFQADIPAEQRETEFLRLIAGTAKKPPVDPIEKICDFAADAIELLTQLSKAGLIKVSDGFDAIIMLEVVRPKSAEKLDTEAKRKRVRSACDAAYKKVVERAEQQAEEAAQ